jgi:chlorite dismutase
MNRETSEPLDIREKGRSADGSELSSDKRLFMQLLAFGGCTDTGSLAAALAEAQIDGVLYEDLNDPRGIALVVMNEDPEYFIRDLRQLLSRSLFEELLFKPEYTMFGRTYALGYETDLESALIHRPSSRIRDPELPWGIWYPLRRSGSFEQLSVKEQRAILREHGSVGRAFGRAGYGHDIRLACHGLDKNDNDFVIGLLGPELYPLSVIVQRMRKTKQTSLHLEQLGPFFIGRAAWKSESNKHDQ